ncbi:MAG: 3'(2'),5'-bisphosphate nucleotidase CysQ [Alphaproteobacteria bacterium]
MSYADLLPEVLDIARRAGVAILEVYRGAFEAERKADGTPVTAADTTSEAIISAALGELTPEIPVIGEESAAAGVAKAVLDERFWLVDPLDGTREFLKRNDEFCVCVGLVSQHAPVLGVVLGPALDVAYAGAEPGTAVVVEGSAPPRPIGCRASPMEGLTAMVSRSHADNQRLEPLLHEHNVQDRRTLGSALKFGVLAAGDADIYPRIGPTHEWDTAAGHAILLSAGGRVETLEGKPLTYGKPGLLNPGFIAFGLR